MKMFLLVTPQLPGKIFSESSHQPAEAAYFKFYDSEPSIVAKAVQEHNPSFIAVWVGNGLEPRESLAEKINQVVKDLGVHLVVY